MDLQELLGADYKEGMTQEEVNKVFESRILSSGKYELSEKVEAERTRAKKEKEALEAKIKGKLSEDELSKQELEELKGKLAEAEEREKISKKETSKLLSKSNLAEMRSMLEIKDNDKEYSKFLEAISVEDNEIANSTSSYVMKLVKNAYEKGKAESTKQNLGQMGSMLTGEDGKGIDKEEAFVKNLAASFVSMNKPINNSNFN